MAVAALQVDEKKRLEALRQLEILDTEPEPEFDELVQLAAALCEAPISLVSLLDEHRQWFKAAIGLDARETPRDVAICDHTIRQTGLLVVEDASQDHRFAASPLVTGPMGWRFYAGVPITASGGEPLGALCVVDRVPRTLTAAQRTALRVLGSQVNARLELRVQRMQLQEALVEAEAARVRLTESEQRFQTFMDCAPVISYLKDEAGRMIYYNRRMAEHFQVSRDFLLNKTDAELWPPEIAKPYRQHDMAVLQSGKLHVIEEESENPNGSKSVWRSYKFPCPDSNGRMLLGGVSVEVTAELRREAELRRYQQELEIVNGRLEQLASLDALTGLANRRTFDGRLESEFARARATQHSLCLVLLDIDDFKQHNDRFGHSHGDVVLRGLGRCLQEHLRGGDLLARYGGEEFAILLPGLEEHHALALAERMLNAVRAYAWPNRPVTISLGVASLRPSTLDAQHLFTLADEALYAAKHAGKDQAVSYGDVYAAALAIARRGRPSPVVPTEPLATEPLAL